MTLSDELIVADVGSFDWGQKDQKVFLNWSDAGGHGIETKKNNNIQPITSFV